MKNTDDLTLEECWDIMVDMTSNMSEDEREEFIMDWGE